MTRRGVHRVSHREHVAAALGAVCGMLAISLAVVAVCLTV